MLKSQGTYFLTVDLSPLGLNETDEAFCKRIVNDYKVAAIPVSAFYEQDAVTSVVRFCFAKKDATLDTALERLSDAVHRPQEVSKNAKPVSPVSPWSCLAAALLLSAGAGEGRAERVVNFYNWSNYMAPGVLEDFTKETGIKVVYDTFDANETLETRLLAGKSGYDVVVPTAYFLQRQITANIFQKLDKSKLPNLANAWPVVTRALAIYDPGNHLRRQLHVGHDRHRLQRQDGAEDPWARCARSTAGTSSSSRKISRSSRIAASTCWIPPTTFSRRR